MKLADLLPHHDLKKGIFFILLTWLCYSTIYMFSKLIGPQTTVATMVFLPNLFGLIIILPWALKSFPKNFKMKNPWLMFLRALVGVSNVFFIFLAVKSIPLVDATLLNNTAPFFVPFILWLWLRTPINHKMWPAIIVGFIGLALILHPSRHIFNFGSIFGLISGISLSMIIITMRLMAKTEQTIPLIFYFFLIASLLSLPFAIADWKILNWTIFFILLCMGILSIMGQWLLFQGLKYGKAHELAPFTYSSVIFSGIYQWLIWDIQLRWIFFIGMILIVSSGVWIVYLSRPPKD